jgi:hypothetical protein
MNDIKSPEAKSLYEKRLDLSKQINELSYKLEDLRTVYAKGNATKKEQLKPTILQAEEQLYGMLRQPDEMEKRARNAEINYLLKLNR